MSDTEDSFFTTRHISEDLEKVCVVGVGGGGGESVCCWGGGGQSDTITNRI